MIWFHGLEKNNKNITAVGGNKVETGTTLFSHLSSISVAIDNIEEGARPR